VNVVATISQMAAWLSPLDLGPNLLGILPAYLLNAVLGPAALLFIL
jgi:hypothetical protein